MALGSILTGVGAALSGASGIASLFNKPSKTGMGPEASLNYGIKSKMSEIYALTEAAKKYGFHPLALLGNGGFQPGPMGMPDGGSSPWMAGDAVGQALSGLGDFYSQDADREDRRRERDDLERERRYMRHRDTLGDARANDADRLNRRLMEAQIEEITSRTRINNMRAKAVGAAPSTDSLRPPTVTMPYSGPWRRKPGTSSASEIQNELGDFSEMQANVEQFIYNLLNDPAGTPLDKIKRATGRGPFGMNPP